MWAAAPAFASPSYPIASSNLSYFEAVAADDSFDKKLDIQSSAYYTALFTLNGFLYERPSFLQTTMKVISFLPLSQRMPVVGA